MKRWLLMGLVMLGACHKAEVSPERAFVVYDVAWRCGQRDRLTPSPRDWHRYQDKLAAYPEVPAREKIFQGGYQDGFEQHPDEPVSDAILDYDREFRRGRVDAWAGKDSNSSSKGYQDGYGGRTHAFERPY